MYAWMTKANIAPELSELMANHSFVGIVDRRLCLSLVQCGTKLLLVNHATLGSAESYFVLSKLINETETNISFSLVCDNSADSTNYGLPRRHLWVTS